MKKNVLHSKEKEPTPLPDRIICTKGRPFELVETDNKSRVCDFCCEQFPQEGMSKKWKHKDFVMKKVTKIVNKKETIQDVEEDCCGIKDICCKCYAKYFVRRKLDKKTANHARFEAF